MSLARYFPEKLPVSSSIITNLVPGVYSAEVFPGSDTTSCSNKVEFTILALPQFTASSAETAVSCKGMSDGTAAVDFTHAKDVAAFKDPASNTVNYANYVAFDDNVMFLVADESDVVTTTAAGWKKATDYATEKEFVIASLGLKTTVKFTANSAAASTDVDGQPLQTDKFDIKGLKAGNYTVWFKYGNYDACLYHYDFTITEPADDIEITPAI